MALLLLGLSLISHLFGRTEPIKNKEGDTALLLAIQAKNMGYVMSLIGVNADVNAKQKSGWTPLMFAARDGLSECVNALIRAKAVVNAQSDEGWSPLMLAARNGKIKCLSSLIAANADVNARTAQGSTALALAARCGHTECLASLIAANADLTVRDRDGNSALLWAAWSGATDCVKTLINAKADVNEKDKDGWTILMCVARKGYVECVRILLEAGADWKITTPKGNTAEDIAIHNKHIQVANILAEPRKKLEAQSEFWKKYFSLSNYVVTGVAALGVVGTLVSTWGSGEQDMRFGAAIGCLVPLFARALATEKVINKPSVASINIWHTVVDALCVLALCLPALSNVLPQEDESESFLGLSVLLHIGIIWFFVKMAKNNYWGNVRNTLMTHMIIKFAIALSLLYLGGGVISGGDGFVDNMRHALTLGY